MRVSLIHAKFGLKNIDEFTRNTLTVFIGTSLVNFFNLLYQLLIAHKLSVSDFAAFNSLLSVFVIISSPLGTIQMAVAKYASEFNAHNRIDKIKFLLSDSLKKVSIPAAGLFLLFWSSSVYLAGMLKIPSISCGYILSALIALSCLTPVFLGALQGLESFGWLASVSVITGMLKLGLAFILILLGFNIAGALGALLSSSLIGLIILYFPLRRFISLKAPKADIDYKEMAAYLFPVAISYLCFFALVGFDMVMVKYFFNPQAAGIYSLAQMAGKIFLFMPAAVSIVMFPKTSSLNAKNLETLTTLKRSLLFVIILCAFTLFIYNLFPAAVLKILTGKVYPESIFLGRLFGASMTFFSLLNVLIAYFLSIKDLRFIKYLILFTLLQALGIGLFHKSLAQVQSLLCVNAALLFFIHLGLVRRGPLPAE